MLIDCSVSGSSCDYNGDSSRSIVDPGDSPPSPPTRDEIFLSSDSNSTATTSTSSGQSNGSHHSSQSSSEASPIILAHETHNTTPAIVMSQQENSFQPNKSLYNATSSAARMFPDSQQQQQPLEYFSSHNFFSFGNYENRHPTPSAQFGSDHVSVGSHTSLSSQYNAKRPRVVSDRNVTNDSETSCLTAMSPLSPSHRSVISSAFSDDSMTSSTSTSHHSFLNPRKPSSASSLGTTTMSVASAEYSTTKSVYSFADSTSDTVKASNLASRYARGMGGGAGGSGCMVAPQPRMLHHPICVEEHDDEDDYDDDDDNQDAYDDENVFQTNEEAEKYTRELLRQMASMRKAQEDEDSSSFGIWYRQGGRHEFSDRCQGSFGLSLAILIFIIGLMVLASGYSNKNKSYYGNAKRTTPRQRSTINVLHLHGISDIMALTTPGTHQYQAAQWMADYDPLQYPIPSTSSDRAPRTPTATADLTLTQYKFIQRYVVTVLFFSLGGGHDWETQVNFLSATDECEWFQFKVLDHHSYRLGISCRDLMHVDAIRLADNQIVGSLPSELQHLFELEELDLQKNAITGTIPQGLTNLITLDLSHNDLTGTLPTALQSMTRLKHLDLGHNSYQGTISSEMGQMVNLELLNLQNNAFTGTIPQEVWDLPEMTECVLNANRLSGSIPTTIANAANLNVLALHWNGLTGEANSLCEKSTSLSIMTVDCDDVQCSNVCCNTCCTAQDEAENLCDGGHQ